jgi:hypothetical protein
MIYFLSQCMGVSAIFGLSHGGHLWKVTWFPEKITVFVFSYYLKKHAVRSSEIYVNCKEANQWQIQYYRKFPSQHQQNLISHVV